MNTATSGYLQRRLIKLMEDLRVQYNQVITDNSGSVFSYHYNYNFDPREMVKTGKGTMEFCDISQIVNKLNIKHEDMLERKSKKK
jgi:DNA-directed RNA polymerase beta' subunit